MAEPCDYCAKLKFKYECCMLAGCANRPGGPIDSKHKDYETEVSRVTRLYRVNYPASEPVGQVEEKGLAIGRKKGKGARAK